ncbi:oxidoreductase [Pseudomonas sp. AFG_SD02_1510_Pfu_092]|nr:oxidoreductase [Pseudomonas sp. AFG_SD02_1510_Pfu_092]
MAGSWEVLLAIGGLYLQSDSLGRNQEKAETEIGPKAHEAKLALQGSYLGVLGGQIELVGLMLRASAYKGMPWAKGAIATGETLVKIGAVVGAVVGFIEAAQAVAAAKRASAAGDSAAAIQYWVAAGFYGVSAIAVAGAALSSTVWGPVGLAVMLALTAYTLSKSAEENESSALERWARRCCFGKADETPVIHWDSPDYADIAFAELNAATLGVQAEFHFESNLVSDPAAPKIGGLISLEREQKIKFKMVLPQYKDAVSAYRWCLIVHRQGDGQFPDYTGGETLIVDEFHARRSTGVSKSASFPGFSPPRLPDYKNDFKFDKKLSSVGHNDLPQLAISGIVELMPTIGAHSIVAATLLVMYWPDRKIESAYIELCHRRENDDA